jgi:subtilase family serine protease
VSKGRVTIEFSGTADQVRQAFHTEIHRYLVDGEAHIANDRDPEVPAALFPVIEGIASLHNFFPTHQSVFGGFVKRDRKTGKMSSIDAEDDVASPELTYTDGGGKVHEDVTPYDFATIYNLLPLWKEGIDGTGQKIAISAVSDILQSDIDTFRSSFGLPASTLDVIHNGADPGVVTGATVENTLDAQWSGAAAPKATIVLVVTQSTATFGGQLSDSYIVDNKVATITSASYGLCEGANGTAGNAALNKIYQQGSAEGISMFVSAGDQGSTGCDSSDKIQPASDGLQVNGWASSPYVTGVGGTDFNWYQATNRTTYWSSANNSDGATAKGYIPELPWNATCTSAWLLTANPSFGTSEDLCLNVAISTTFDNLVRVVGGSGGVSACTTITGNTLANCSGGYPKPAWQSVTGVPNDTKRDVPDV